MVAYSSSDALFTGKGWVSNRWIIHEMVQEYGIAKTYTTIQTLYDNEIKLISKRLAFCWIP